MSETDGPAAPALVGDPLRVVLDVNGVEHELLVQPERTLLEVLREDLGLTGTKLGCGKGDCGACTVLVDGTPANSCLVLAARLHGRRVTTIEGLARAGHLAPLEEAFLRAGAVQCGYCTPGMLVVASALVAENPSPTREEIIRAISGNLCRCTGYQQIVEAIELCVRR